MTVALIGSRNCPYYIEQLAYLIGKKLDVEMNSGGAVGMDSAFERGYIDAGKSHLMNIILPGNNFNGKNDFKDNYYNIKRYPDRLILKAEHLVKDIHPHWPLIGFAYWAHIRNVFQILGHDLNHPVTEVICWAPINGTSVKGGTRTAVEVAKMHNIPVHNMANVDTLKALKSRFNISEPSLNFL